MKNAAWTGLAALAAGAAQGPAFADARCDCATKLGACTARVKIESTRVLVSSSTPQCSMVVFHVDGQPKVTTVLDGISSEDWLGPTAAPRLEIDSCTVCADRNFPSTAALPGAGFVGTWHATGRCSWGSNSYTFSIDAVREGRVSASGSFGNCSFDEGQVSGDAIAMTCSNWLNTVRYRGKLVSPSRIEGTYSQSTSGETCAWQATRAP